MTISRCLRLQYISYIKLLSGTDDISNSEWSCEADIRTSDECNQALSGARHYGRCPLHSLYSFAMSQCGSGTLYTPQAVKKCRFCSTIILAFPDRFLLSCTGRRNSSEYSLT